jgi:hypothetical protein
MGSGLVRGSVSPAAGGKPIHEIEFVYEQL